MSLIATLDQLKDELGLLGTTAYDDRLQLKLDISEEWCLDYVKNLIGSDEEVADWYAEVDSWDDQTAPKRMIGAILWLAAHLYKHGGDAHPEDTPTTNQNELPRQVSAMLARLRDPTIA